MSDYYEWMEDHDWSEAVITEALLDWLNLNLDGRIE